MDRVTILLVGDTDRSEFRDARAALDAAGDVVEAADPQHAAAILADGQLAPEVIVVAKTYPTQFSDAAIDRLRRAAPLARVLVLLGSWCEGEMRSGKPWPATVPIYWHQWPPRASGEFDHMRQGECSVWGLPITATEEERLLLAASRPLPVRQGLVAIHTRRFEVQDWLSVACRSLGLSTVWLRPPHTARVEGAAAAIFDGSDCRGDEPAQLEDLAAKLAPTPVIALLDFPRIEDHRRALDAGASAVISKPLLVEDLFWELDRVWESAAGV